MGDSSAVVSLKALIPDRDPVEGLFNYGPRSEEGTANWTEQQQHEEEQRELAKLKAAAQDPLLRRLVTVHILATATSPDYFTDDSMASAMKRGGRWLNIIKQANLGQLARMASSCYASP